MKLKVICIDPRGSKKIVKGAVYEAISLSTNSYGNQNRFLYINELGSYNANCFRLLNGDTLDSTSDFRRERRSLQENKNYKGCFVRCRYSNSKMLKDGEIYYVEEHKIFTTSYKDYKGKTQFKNDHKFKLRGIKSWMGIYSFEELDDIELRKIKLCHLAGKPVKTGDQTRKFLLYSKKKRLTILLDVFNRTLSDLSKSEVEGLDIDIIKMMVKRGTKYNIIEDDVKEFLKLNLNELSKNII